MKKEVAIAGSLIPDPIYDCPTDPTIIWNREEKQWYLFIRREGPRIPLPQEFPGYMVQKSASLVSKDGGKWLYRENPGGPGY